MARAHPITQVFHGVVGFFLGSLLFLAMFFGVALFVSQVVMSPTMSGAEFARGFDLVVGPGALLFSVLGAVAAVLKARREAEGGAAGPEAGARARTAARVALAGLVGLVAIGFMAWPWVLWSKSQQPFFPGALTPLLLMVAATAIGVFVARLRRRPMDGEPPPRRRGQLVDLSPQATALVVGVTTAVTIMTLAGVSTWHELLFVFAGIPLTMAVCVAHLVGLAYFLREPERAPAGE